MHVLIRAALASHCLVAFFTLGVGGVFGLGLIEASEDKVSEFALHKVRVDISKDASGFSFDDADVVDTA